jgi:hypothetical protein
MKIRQIIPADGWYAAIACCHPDEEAHYYLERLAAWALIEHDGERRLTGMGASLDVEFLDAYEVSPTVDMAWLGYVHADDLTTEKEAHLQRRAEYEQKFRRSVSDDEEEVA